MAGNKLLTFSRSKIDFLTLVDDISKALIFTSSKSEGAEPGRLITNTFTFCNKSADLCHCPMLFTASLPNISVKFVFGYLIDNSLTVSRV